MKSEYWQQNTLLEEQTKSSRSTWPWFEHMTSIMESFAKEKVYLERLIKALESCWRRGTQNVKNSSVHTYCFSMKIG